MGTSLRRRLAVALLAFAAVVLLTAYVMICVRTGSPWPWTRVVHEDGQRTLLLTILYFEHATRELPLDVLLGIAIGGCACFACPCVARPLDRMGGARPISIWAWSTVLVVTIIVVGTAMQGGRPMVLDNLLQNHTRPGAALAWGSHWRYHLLERIALMLISVGFAGMLRWLVDGRTSAGVIIAGDRHARFGLGITGGAIGVYLLLTIVFAYSPASLLDPLRHPLYLGHQARELFTHALVTLPVAWGACMFALPETALAAPPSRSSLLPTRASGLIVLAIGTGATGLFIGAYVCVAALRSDSISHGQTSDLAMLIFPHFFEHSFTYLVVPVVAVLVYKIAADRAASGVAVSNPSARATRERA